MLLDTQDNAKFCKCFSHLISDIKMKIMFLKALCANEELVIASVFIIKFDKNCLSILLLEEILLCLSNRLFIEKQLDKLAFYRKIEN